MTKEEIRKVLELALEYYKLEIYGTGKESEPPTEARINWIYERMKPSLPSDVEEAAKESLPEEEGFLETDIYGGSEAVYSREQMLAMYKAGAQWQKEQMMKDAVEGEVENASFGIVYLRKNLTNDGYSTGDKVRVIIVKEEQK